MSWRSSRGYPCKACVHRHAVVSLAVLVLSEQFARPGQRNDWMHEIYPRWVAAHGVMIVSPVHRHQAPSVLKLMIDRLVCADGGNPDPIRTEGKHAKKAKAIELAGWDYPRHLKGRAFCVVVHGDTAGAETLRRNLRDWLRDLVPAGGAANIDRYIDYYGLYATSHQALDQDQPIQQQVRNAARALLTTVGRLRAGELRTDELPSPRPK